MQAGQAQAERHCPGQGRPGEPRLHSLESHSDIYFVSFAPSVHQVMLVVMAMLSRLTHNFSLQTHTTARLKSQKPPLTAKRLPGRESCPWELRLEMAPGMDEAAQGPAWATCHILRHQVPVPSDSRHNSTCLSWLYSWAWLKDTGVVSQGG